MDAQDIDKVLGDGKGSQISSPRLPVVSPARVKDQDWNAIHAGILGALQDCQGIAPAGRASAKERWHALLRCLQAWHVPAAMRRRVCQVDHDSWADRRRPSAAAKRRSRLEVQAQDRRAAAEAKAAQAHNDEVRDVRPW